MARPNDDQTFLDDIEAYSQRLSVLPGERVGLCVSTRATSYDVVVERWGAERQELWRAEGLAWVHHEVPDGADAEGCGWPVAVEIPVGDDWASGFHLVTLTAYGAAPERATSHACFVVRARPEARHSTLLVLTTNTWNAYNTWGGRSLYTGGHQVSFRRPFGRGILCRPVVDRDDRKARPTRRGETPDADGHVFQGYRTDNDYPSAIGSTGWFTSERRFVEWAERNGHRFDMAVGTDFDHDPALLDGYDLVLGVGHDEYWSAAGRDAIDRHVARGGNVASFSGNTMFWQVRMTGNGTDDGPAAADHMICHKYKAHLNDPVAADHPEQMTGMWCDPLVGRPEWSTLGAGSAHGLYHRFGEATARGVGGFQIVEPDHWMLDGTGLRWGDAVGVDDGVVGYETLGAPLAFTDDQRLVVRHGDPTVADHMPADHTIVGFTLSSNLAAGEYPKSIAALSDQGDLEFIATRLAGDTEPETLDRWRRGNALMLECRPHGDTGGRVVTVGTTDWIFGLDASAVDDNVGRVTDNVLRHLG